MFQAAKCITNGIFYDEFSDKELLKDSNTHFLRVPFSDKTDPFYSLDVIISINTNVYSMLIFYLIF